MSIFRYSFAGIPQKSTGNNYLYNGKELQPDFGLNWYDYGARFYDAAVGRWWSIDPLCEKYYSISLYAYCAGNPIKFIDSQGKEIWISFVSQQNGATESYQYKSGKLYASNGNEVSISNVSHYTFKVYSQLNQLKRDDYEVGSMLASLENSENTHTITNFDKKYHDDVNMYDIFQKLTACNLASSNISFGFKNWSAFLPPFFNFNA